MYIYFVKYLFFLLVFIYTQIYLVSHKIIFSNFIFGSICKMFNFFNKFVFKVFVFFNLFNIIFSCTFMNSLFRCLLKGKLSLNIIKNSHLFHKNVDEQLRNADAFLLFLFLYFLPFY